MNPKILKRRDVLLIAIVAFFQIFLIGIVPGFSQSSAELNGDVVEYSIDGNKVTARGHVSVFYKDSQLYCDKVEYSRVSEIAVATGNVKLVTKEGEIRGQKVTFDYSTMKGEFESALIFADPFYGKAQRIRRESANKLIMYHGYMTTSDYDNPGYRLISPIIDVYPGDKLVAKHVRMNIGKVPVFYSPRYIQNLKDKRPWITYTPGYDKDWGLFLLTQIHYYKDENFKAKFHLDFREKKDVAEGVDVTYNTEKYGDGLVRLYYMNERNITSKRWYQERPSPTIERERFSAEWRHKWDIDSKTKAIAQYYKISDNTFLKDYFEKEYEEDSSPDTYFFLTRTLPYGTASFRVESRVNRFVSAVERMPELQYNLSSTELFDTGLYLKNTTSYTNLKYLAASPTEKKYDTSRIHSDSQLSYPTKISFIEFKPYVGIKHTYYSRYPDDAINESVRGAFRTGASLSTKFHRIFDLGRTIFDSDSNYMRHIITPTVEYNYATDPTIYDSDINQFDAIDSLTNDHEVKVSVENKFQIKREGETVDLLRWLLSSTYRMKEITASPGFSVIESDFEFKPNDFITFYADSEYNVKADYLKTANFDIYINGKDEKWRYAIGKRFERNLDDLVTQTLEYRVNRKWKLRLYNKFDIMNGILKEQDYVVTRDLHSWEMDLNFNETRNEGNEILIVFRLKAFPEIGIDAGTGFNKRKAGSQSGEGE